MQDAPAPTPVTLPNDRVPARTKIAYGLGTSVDMWGHWLYPNLAYQGLGNELTPDYHERTSVMSYKMVIQKCFEVAFFIGLPFTNLAWFTIAGTGKQNVLLGVQVFCGILGLIMVLNSVLVFFNVK